jgi:hypothetical protein
MRGKGIYFRVYEKDRIFLRGIIYYVYIIFIIHLA